MRKMREGEDLNNISSCHLDDEDASPLTTEVIVTPPTMGKIFISMHMQPFTAYTYI